MPVPLEKNPLSCYTGSIINKGEPRMRLDKYLAETAQCTRSEAKVLLSKGRVQVNGAVCKKGDTQLRETDTVAVDGKALNYQQFVYLMLNKPEGVVSASTDKRDTTVVDLIGDAYPRRELFPAGRLDKTSTGFVLLTDDGTFAHEILAPKRHVSKTYTVVLDTPLTEEMRTGFAAGVMVAASVWSLLIPAMEQAADLGRLAFFPAAAGFWLGILFLLLLDHLIPHLHQNSLQAEGPKSQLQRTTMMVLAVTLHNIPEGMAVGLAFALAAHNDSSVLLASAIALAIGMGIQNFPEGAAIALPLRQSGMSRAKAFGLGTLSGIVEPVFGLLTVLAAGAIQPLLPWLLAFAAGAMLYVVVEELIPEAHLGEGHMGTVGVMLGFLLMMILDVALG